MKRISCILAVAVAAAFLSVLCYRYNYIPHKKYSADAFGIPVVRSERDMDGDGIDDQTDILQGAKEYVGTRPKYKSKYYQTGYPDDGYGVCTDVVAFAMKNAGYDLRELVDADITNAPEDYQVKERDKNIDFRRVVNLQVYFSHTAKSLTTDTKKTGQWQGGDIVVWAHHIGIVSDARNSKGVPFVLHHANSIQASYEEDILTTYGSIVGHYRMR